MSQINNCAFCLQIHLNVSRRLGVPQEKLDLVATWHEAGIFSDKECAALAWAELLTRLADRSVPDEAYEAVCRHFSQDEVIALSVAIANINAWNGWSGFPLRPADPEEGGDGRLRLGRGRGAAGDLGAVFRRQSEGEDHHKEERDGDEDDGGLESPPLVGPLLNRSAACKTSAASATPADAASCLTTLSRQDACPISAGRTSAKITESSRGSAGPGNSVPEKMIAMIAACSVVSVTKRESASTARRTGPFRREAAETERPRHPADQEPGEQRRDRADEGDEPEFDGVRPKPTCGVIGSRMAGRRPAARTTKLEQAAIAEEVPVAKKSKVEIAKAALPCMFTSRATSARPPALSPT